MANGNGTSGILAKVGTGVAITVTAAVLIGAAVTVMSTNNSLAVMSRDLSGVSKTLDRMEASYNQQLQIMSGRIQGQDDRIRQLEIQLGPRGRQ